ncbi:hypothetical protein ACJX0J_041775, partial [Zea mays]
KCSGFLKVESIFKGLEEGLGLWCLFLLRGVVPLIAQGSNDGRREQDKIMLYDLSMQEELHLLITEAFHISNINIIIQNGDTLLTSTTNIQNGDSGIIVYEKLEKRRIEKHRINVEKDGGCSISLHANEIC